MAHFAAWPLSVIRCSWPNGTAIAPDMLDEDHHLLATIDWIVAAHRHAPDGGIPAYFNLLRNRWTASYPETTGYTIPTLLAVADHLGRAELRTLARRLADYLLAVRTAEGGVGEWGTAREGRTVPIVFDTGQVIFGWLAVWRDTGDGVFLEAAGRAGDWLVAVQDSRGAWLRHQHGGVVKVIDVRVAWALLCLAQATGQAAYRVAARRNLDWALAQQRPSGWFAHAGFARHADPTTHAIAYTAEGLLEAGLLLGDDRYVTAAAHTGQALLRSQRGDGSLAGTYADGWRPTARASCLTGNCQVALLWLRLAGLGRPDAAYRAAAQRAIAYVASTQDLQTDHPGIRGGIAGSHPIYGHYARFRYPNWAAKFFADALLALAGEPTRSDYPG